MDRKVPLMISSGCFCLIGLGSLAGRHPLLFDECHWMDDSISGLKMKRPDRK